MFHKGFASTQMRGPINEYIQHRVSDYDWHDIVCMMFHYFHKIGASLLCLENIIYIYRLSLGRYFCFHWAAFSGFWLVGTVRSLVLQEPAFFFKPSDSWRAFVSLNTCNGSHLYKSLQHFQFSWFYSISIAPKLHIYTHIYIYIQLTLAVLSDEQMSGPDDDVPY